MNDQKVEKDLDPIIFYCEHKLWAAPCGATIRESVPYGAKPPADHVRFVGITSVGIEYDTPQGRRRQSRPVEFPIAANSIKDAFCLYTDLAVKTEKDTVSRLRKEAMAPQIVVPAGIKAS